MMPIDDRLPSATWRRLRPGDFVRLARTRAEIAATCPNRAMHEPGRQYVRECSHCGVRGDGKTRQKERPFR